MGWPSLQTWLIFRSIKCNRELDCELPSQARHSLCPTKPSSEPWEPRGTQVYLRSCLLPLQLVTWHHMAGPALPGPLEPVPTSAWSPHNSSTFYLASHSLCRVLPGPQGTTPRFTWAQRPVTCSAWPHTV